MQEFHDGPRSMLRLDPGDDLIGALEELAQRHRIAAGVVTSGIGQLARATVAYWNGSRYVPLELDDPHELVSLQGTIAEDEGRPSVHLHAGLADRDHRLRGGHLLNGTVGLTAEIHVHGFDGHAFGRPLVEELGVRITDLAPGRPARDGPGPTTP